MVNNNQVHDGRFCVPWDARKFQGVRNLTDYQLVKARTPADGGAAAAGTVAQARSGGIGRWERLTPGEKFKVVTGAATIAGAAVAIISLVIH